MAALALLLFAMLPLASLWAITTMPTGLMQAAALLALMLLSTATPWPGNSRMDAY
jgi:NADH:ubiquinone oxidoreductase subunit H